MTDQAGGGGCDAVVDFEAGLAGEERHGRLPVANFTLQAFLLCERYVGRVGDDQIHRLGGDGIHEVADDELDAGGQAAGVGGGYGDGGGRDIGGQDLGTGFQLERDGERAGAGADVENAADGGGDLQGRLHHVLGFGTGDQHIGSDAEIAAAA